MRWLALCFCLLACSSPKKDAYRSLARQANPILEALRPTAARLLAVDPTDHKAVIAACTSADEELWKLREIRFDNEYVDTEPKYERVSSLAASQLDNRRVTCRDLPPHLIEACSKWCRSEWMQMIDTVELLRRGAKSEGIELVSLKP